MHVESKEENKKVGEECVCVWEGEGWKRGGYSRACLSKLHSFSQESTPRKQLSCCSINGPERATPNVPLTSTYLNTTKSIYSCGKIKDIGQNRASTDGGAFGGVCATVVYQC